MGKKMALAILSVALLTLGGCASQGPRFMNVRSYSEGLAAAQNFSGKWGYIDEEQKWAIVPRFEDAKDFQNGRAGVKQNGKWGFVDKRGEWQGKNVRREGEAVPAGRVAKDVKSL